MQQEQISVLDINQTLYCKTSKNVAQYLCNNTDCQQNSIICIQQSCLDCNKHQKCSKVQISILLHKIHKRLKPLSQQSQKSKLIIQNIFDQIIQKISLSRQHFLDFAQLLQLDQKTKQLIELINKGQFYQQKINGELVSNVLKQLQQTCQYELISCNQLEELNPHLQINQKTNNLLKKLNYLSKKNNIKNKQLCHKFISQFIASSSGQNCRACANGKRFSISQMEKFGYQLQQVQELKLSMSNIGKIVTETKYMSNLVNIIMRKCQIGRLQNFDYLFNLQLLVLSQNNIKKMENLSSLVQLKRLVLSKNSNNIKIIENISLENNPNIVEIWLHTIISDMTEPELTLLDHLVQNKITVYSSQFKRKYESRKIKQKMLQVK